jgi:hypothetical protein
MASIEERKAKAQELLKSYRDIPNATFGGYFINKDLEHLNSGQGYTVDSSGAVTLKDTGYLIPGGLTTDQKQSAAEAYNELQKIKTLEGVIAGRNRTKLREYAGGALTNDNIAEAIEAYEEGKAKDKITDERTYETTIRGEGYKQAAEIRKDQALEAEKIRADSNLRASQDRLLEAQMRNADRSLEREMRMYEIDEKGSNRKAELFKALFGLGSAFMI